MTKKQYIGFIILVVAIFGGIFYWYSFRPSIIKKDCHNEASNKAIQQLGDYDTKFFRDAYDTYYKWCLQEKGL